VNDLDLGRTGRQELLGIIRQQRKEIAALHTLLHDYPHILANLTATQVRSTEQKNELRHYQESTFLPGLGWDCPNPKCGVFNGDLKERRTTCRSCQTPRPT
jgi:hypothetical protein